MLGDETTKNWLRTEETNSTNGQTQKTDRKNKKDSNSLKQKKPNRRRDIFFSRAGIEPATAETVLK